VSGNDFAAPSPELTATLRREAERWGTPLYAYDDARLTADAAAVAAAFPDPTWTRLYSLKANGLPGLVERVSELGFGANAVSEGELSLAERAGIPPERTALEGIGKAESDLAAAVDVAARGRPLMWVSIESHDEAAALADLAARTLTARDSLDVLVRVNPAVEPETSEGLAVGRRGSKFGVAPEEIPSVIRAGGGVRWPLRWRGLHVHVGSQLSSVHAWRSAVADVLGGFAVLSARFPTFDTLDVGGGFPAGLDEGPTPGEFARAFGEALRGTPWQRRPSRVAIEPGRAVVAGAGWLVARVLHMRDRTPPQVVLDAGMTELIRPALYGAHHPVAALTSMGQDADGVPRRPTLVEGPVCESTDRFGMADLPPLERGDLVAVGMAGAYAGAMFSSYNGRVRPPEVLLRGEGERKLLRRRGRLADLP